MIGRKDCHNFTASSTVSITEQGVARHTSLRIGSSTAFNYQPSEVLRGHQESGAILCRCPLICTRVRHNMGNCKVFIRDRLD